MAKITIVDKNGNEAVREETIAKNMVRKSRKDAALGRKNLGWNFKKEAKAKDTTKE